MRNFKITVNGVGYDVAVEEVASDGSVSMMPQSPAPAPRPAAAAAAPAAPQTNVSSSAFKLLAPMPGSIVDIKVNVGDTVTKDQVGIVLEAMKMENEIFIPVEGKVTSINVTKGAAVKTDDVLLTVE